jgi:hypothetical protein
MNRRFGVVIVAAVVLVACSGERRGDEPAPRVAQFVCEEDGTRALTPFVQATSVGIHIEIDNEAGARQFYLRSTAQPDQNQGGKLEAGGVTELTTTMPPGGLAIGCFGRGADIPYSEVTSDFAEITIVDPDDLWIPPELPCAGYEEEQERYVDGQAKGFVPEDADDLVRSTVPWIVPTDHIIRPGYPETQWHAEFRHVVRNGTPIASASVFQEHGRWKVLVRGCPGAITG